MGCTQSSSERKSVPDRKALNLVALFPLRPFRSSALSDKIYHRVSDENVPSRKFERAFYLDTSSSGYDRDHHESYIVGLGRVRFDRVFAVQELTKNQTSSIS